MRKLALLVLTLVSLGCTTQSTGARCEQDQDCNGPTDLCRSENNPTTACAGGNCVCCPADLTAARAIAVCTPRTTPLPDAGATDTGATD